MDFTVTWWDFSVIQWDFNGVLWWFNGILIGQMEVYIMRYSWDISSCNQTWRARTSFSYSSMFFPAGENHGFLTFPWIAAILPEMRLRMWGLGDWPLNLWPSKMATWFLGMSSKWYPNMVPFITAKMRFKIRNHQFSGYCTVFWNKPKWGSKGIGCFFFLVAPSIPLRILEDNCTWLRGKLIATWCHTIEMLRVERSVWFVWPICFLWIIMGNPWSSMDAWYI